MANIKSAQKRVRQTKIRTARNKAIKTRVKTMRNKLGAALESEDEQASLKALRDYSSAVDKACKKNIFHRNKAANLKSKAAKALREKTS